MRRALLVPVAAAFLALCWVWMRLLAPLLLLPMGVCVGLMERIDTTLDRAHDTLTRMEADHG